LNGLADNHHHGIASKGTMKHMKWNFGISYNYMEFCDWSRSLIQRHSPFHQTVIQ
jgi:hypothetical protein